MKSLGRFVAGQMWLLRWRLPVELAEFVIGDLEEEFRRRSYRHRYRATVWLSWQAMLCVMAPPRHPRTTLLNRRTGDTGMRSFVQDVRYAVRLLRKAPGFSSIAIGTMSVGVAATSIIFSLVNTLILRPLPYPASDRLVAISETLPSGPPRRITGARLDTWQKHSQAFESLAGFEFDAFNVAVGGEPESIDGAWVTPEFFDVLGTPPIIGRLPERSAVSPEMAAVVVTHGFWKRRLGGDASALGRSIRLFSIDATSAPSLYTVTAVLPETFWFGNSQFDLWVVRSGGSAPWQQIGEYQVIGRMREGVTGAAAASELTRLSAPDGAMNANTGARIRTLNLQEQFFGEPGVALLLVLGIAVLVLIVACANLASLLMARATARQREVAVRSAVGADRARVVRQFLTESFVLAIVSGLVAVVLTWLTLPAIVAMVPAEARALVPGGADSVKVDVIVFVFALTVSVLVGTLFSLWPTLQASRTDLKVALQSMSTGVTATFRTARFSTGLVVAQCALSLALVASAGLMARSVQNLTAVSLGFEPQGLIKGDLFLSAGQFASVQEQTNTYSRIMESLKRTPGVSAASLTSAHPLRLASRDVLLLGDKPTPDVDNQPAAADIIVTADYFETLRARLLDGRFLTDTDDAAAPLVAVINRSFLERYWSGESAIGKRIKVGGLRRDGSWVTVVGVVDNIPEELSAGPVSPALFRPLAQVPSRFMFLMARGHGDRFTTTLQTAIAAAEPSQPLTNIESMSQVVASASWTTRFLTTLLAAAALLGLGLAALGLYGLITFLVAQQRKEFAVRCALGATPAQIRKTVFRYGRQIIVPGLGLGLLAAALIGQLFGGLVVGVSTFDPLTMTFASATLFAAGSLACYLPARVASRVALASLLRIE